MMTLSVTDTIRATTCQHSDLRDDGADRWQSGFGSDIYDVANLFYRRARRARHRDRRREAAFAAVTGSSIASASCSPACRSPR